MRGLFLAALLCLTALAGCASDDGRDEPVAVVPGPTRATTPGGGLDTSLLSEDSYDMGPRNEAYVPAADGILLHIEWYLPDGKPGPWPTILENSPYNGQQLEQVAYGPWTGTATLNTRYVPKGYAVAFADVRGTAESEGCMDMMGAKEQHDTYALVEWIAAQPWSDGNVGMQGVSYVGTTPHEALIENPPHLKAVATVAGVTNQWRNMYQNGVPYTSRFYPLTYAAGDGAPPPLDVTRGPAWALNAANGACGQESMAEHVRPGVYEKGVYDAYWAERNFTVKASGVTVPLLYSQGFIDRAVNPMEAVYWFNAVQGPKKGFFHQDGHQYVDREDYFDTELAWFDHYLKGIDNGVDRMPIFEVLTNTDQVRLDDEWPPSDARPLSLNLTWQTLATGPVEAGVNDYLAPLAANALGTATGSSPIADVKSGDLQTELRYRGEPLAEDLYMSGNAWMHLQAESSERNTYFLFDLMDEASDGSTTFVAEGWFNAHLHEGFDHSAPLTPGERYAFDFKFEPRDYVFEQGHRILLVLHGSDPGVMPFDTPAAVNTVIYGPEGSWLELPVLESPQLFPRPDRA
jgi:uncharacterized protein